MKKSMQLLLALLVLLLWATPLYAAQAVTVQVPNFPVKLDGVAYDNQHAQYPLLVYRDVTYFPMTYQLTRALGLVTAWDAKQGLYIAQHREDGYEQVAAPGGSNKLGGKYKATVADYPVMVNGWPVENGKEPYPLLNFRGVTYFPLSWHYAHDEFGWDIRWDQKTGLAVHQSGSLEDGSITLIQLNQQSALFQYWASLYDTAENEYGDTTYTHAGERIQNYRLDFATDRVQKAGTEKAEVTWQPYAGEDVSAAFALTGGQLLYEGHVLVGDVPEVCNDHPVVQANRFRGQSADLLEVQIYYTEVPAPYTPYMRYVFLESKGDVKPAAQWEGTVRRVTQSDGTDNPSGFYETKTAYYVCSDSRNVAGRFYNGLHTVVQIDKASGQETVLNDLYSKYRSLEAIGVAGDKLYVRAIYFGEEEDLKNPMFSAKVNPLQDGYFYIDGENKLHKVHDYVGGEPFLAPNGKLYVYSTDRLRITNLTDHRQVQLVP